MKVTRAQRVKGMAAVGALLLGGALTGCSGGSDDSMSSAGDSGSEDFPGTASAQKDSLDGSGSGTASGTDSAGLGDTGLTDAGLTGNGAGRVGVQPPSVISVGKVSLESKELDPVREELDRLLGRYGGYVTNERTVNDAHGTPKTSSLELRVPSAHFDDVMSAFEEFSTVKHTDREATDVTTEVIDVDARVRTQQVSLDRLRRFLGKARDVNAMIRLESEIAQREADLGSLLAQQKYLADQTSLATIDVTMTRTSAAKHTDDDPLAHAGFLTGLRNGWHALVGVLVVAVTVLGAVAPFVILLVLIGAPLAWWARSARRRRRPVATPEPAA
jgi:hypothetical protein